MTIAASYLLCEVSNADGLLLGEEMTSGSTQTTWVLGNLLGTSSKPTTDEEHGQYSQYPSAYLVPALDPGEQGIDFSTELHYKCCIGKFASVEYHILSGSNAFLFPLSLPYKYFSHFTVWQN